MGKPQKQRKHKDVKTTAPAVEAKSSVIDKLTNGFTPYIIFVIVVLLGYFQVFSFGFSPLDDDALITQYFETYKDIGNVGVLFKSQVFQEGSSSLFYRPLLMLSYMTDTLLSGEGPEFYHIMSVLYHIGVVMLLFVFLQKLGISKMLAFVFTLIFAIHPMQLHTVAWLPGRNDSLLALFMLSSLIFFINYVRSKRVLDFLVCNVFFALALLTKENAIAIPIIIASCVVLFKYKLDIKQILLFVAVWTAIIGGWMWIRSGIVESQGYGDLAVAVFTNFGDNISAFLIYTGKLFIPTQQALLPIIEDASLIPGIIAVLGLVVVIIISKSKNVMSILFGAFWFLLFLGIPIVHGASSTGEHYENRIYIPFIGILIMLSGFNLKSIKAFQNQQLKNVIPIMLVVLFIGITNVRGKVYKDKDSFRMACVEDTPSNGRSYEIRGNGYFTQADEETNKDKQKLLYQKAANDFEKARTLNRKYANVYDNMGIAYYNLNQFDKAIESYNTALSIKPDKVQTLENRGLSYSKMGEFEKSLADYNRAIQLAPDEANGYTNRGSLYRLMKEYDKAIADFDRSLAIEPNSVTAQNNKGNVFYTGSIFPEAIKCYDKAIELDPNYADAFHNRAASYYELGNLHINKGQLATALPLYENALKDALAAREKGFRVADKFIQILSNGIAEMKKRLSVK